MGGKTRVLIIDSQPLIRKGLHATINEIMDMELTGETANGEQALVLARRGDADVVVLDLSMADADGIETLRRLRYEFPDLPVLILGINSESDLAVLLLRAGAAGYILKNVSPRTVVDAIRTVSRGKKYVPEEIVQLLATQPASEAAERPHERLSDREIQVLRLISSGNLPSEIAETLAISPKTVSTYRRRILQKLELRTDADIARYAMQKGLI